MKRKFVAFALCAAMAVCMLAGCGGKQPQSPDESNSGKEVEEQTAAESGQDEQEEQDELKEQVALRLIMYGDWTARREKFFKNEFHDAVLKDLNIDLTVEFMPWGSDTNVATMLASGEAFAVWNIVQNYDWPSKGYLAEIDKAMIEEHCPNLIRVRGENNGFECVKHDGKIYAIPFGSKPYSGRMQSYQVRNDILNSVGYDADDIHTYDVFMEALAAVNEKYPEMRIINNPITLNGLNSEISDQVLNILEEGEFVYVDESEEGDKIYSLYESDAFKNACKIMEEWAALGYIRMDKISNPSQGDADWSAGNCLMNFGTPGALVDVSLKETVPEAEFKLVKIGDIPKLKTRDYDWGFSISAGDAQNVERWLDLFDWMYRDQETYNFCIYGVEGVDWEYNEDKTIHRLVTDAFFNNWFLEAMDYAIYDPSIPQETISEYENYDNDSILSKAAGFSFDSTAVSGELALMSAVYTELLQPMSYGLLSFDENYDKAIEQLKNAGLDTYVEEYQRQFSEWYQANH